MEKIPGEIIIWMSKIPSNKISIVGGKAANLSKLIRSGFRTPEGFCITTEAYNWFFSSTGAHERIQAILKDTSKSSNECSLQINSLLIRAEIPNKIKFEVINAYQDLLSKFGTSLPIVVRSSASVEDTYISSFAGQFDSFLGIKNIEGLLDSLHKCWLSLYSTRSIAYMRHKKTDTNLLKMAVIVQQLIKATKAGVIFTMNPVTQDKNRIVIEATIGLGNQIVTGQVSPDTFILKKDSFAVIQNDIVEKELSYVYSTEKGKIIKNEIGPDFRMIPTLNKNELIRLAKLANRVESVFGFPQDIEWAMENDNIYIVQTRPISTMV